jgi:hypothetical protein
MKAKLTKAMYGKSMMKKSGMKKYQPGGTTTTRSVDRNEFGSTAEVEKTKRDGSQKVKTVEISNYGSALGTPSTGPTARIDKTKYDANGMAVGDRKTRDISLAAAERKINRISKKATGKTGGYMMTGGMVNSNAKVSALKQAGSKGVKSGVNPKAKASKVTRGRVGGTSTAPKKALPKAGYGMMMKSKKG